jgi:hypothetical protein
MVKHPLPSGSSETPWLNPVVNKNQQKISDYSIDNPGEFLTFHCQRTPTDVKP